MRALHMQHRSSASTYVSTQSTGRGSSWRCMAVESVAARRGKRWQRGSVSAQDSYAEEDDDDEVVTSRGRVKGESGLCATMGVQFSIKGPSGRRGTRFLRDQLDRALTLESWQIADGGATRKAAARAVRWHLRWRFASSLRRPVEP